VVISKFYILSQLDGSSAQERVAMSAEQLQNIQQAELSAVMGPYVTLGFVLLGIWLLITSTQMPKASTESNNINLWPTIKRLGGKKNYVQGVVALVAISAFMSLMFPTIFGLASQGLREDTKIGNSGLIMAIGGGAALPAVQGMISDATGSIHFSYIVPIGV